MSFVGLLDHVVRAYALVSVGRDAGGGNLLEPVAIEPLATTNNARYTRWDHDLKAQGVGDEQTGTGWISREPGSEMERADIVRVMAGKYAGDVVRIVSKTQPGGATVHHEKYVVKPYELAITFPEEPS